MRYRYSDYVIQTEEICGRNNVSKILIEKKEEKENVIKQILYKATNDAIILRSTSAR